MLSNLEQFHLNKIWNIDCVEYMQSLPDKCIDLTLTDFPYGINENYDVFNDTKENVKDLINNSMPEILRISKRILLTCGTRQISWYPESTWIMAWINEAGAGMNPWGFTCWQPILCYGKDAYLENKMGSRHDIIRHNEPSEKNGHPCPKPLKFWIKLLQRGSVKETDIIFDPFMGSGTTAIACLKTNRKFIGCEISSDYCNIANKRIKEYLDQQDLFRQQ